MTAYCRVCGFGHLRADYRGPGSAPESYARFEFGTTLPTLLYALDRSSWRESENANFPKATCLYVAFKHAVGGRPPRYAPPRPTSDDTVYVMYAYG